MCNGCQLVGEEVVGGGGGGGGVGREEDWDSPRSHRFLLSPIVLVLAEKSSLFAFFLGGGHDH